MYGILDLDMLCYALLRMLEVALRTGEMDQDAACYFVVRGDMGGLLVG